MSGSTGADRVLKEDIPKIVSKMKSVLSSFSFEHSGENIFPFKGNTTLSGSINTNPTKTNFGDVDLIVSFEVDDTSITKNIIAAELKKWLEKNQKSLLIPFRTEKHKGKLANNSFGSIVTIMIEVPGKKGSTAQVDIILAMGLEEMNFKKGFLDLPAEKQGLVLGLIKTVLLEGDPKSIFKNLNLKYKKLPPTKEYDFTLSSGGLSIDITDSLDSGVKKPTKENIAKITNWDVIKNLLSEYDIDKSQFDDLLIKIKNKSWKSNRSLKRLKGVFGSMVLVTHGEIGTEKGEKKQSAINAVEDALKDLIGESLFETYLRIVKER
jgi:hypothetical protein